MPTYYEILKLQPTATAAEIETTIEEQYNQWRRLITHHDPSIVEEANRALRILEQIRATLTDPDKRAVYDAAIGVSGPVGGLADPEALLQRTPPPPLAPPEVRPAVRERERDWSCPKCQALNPVGTRHCSKCGHQIGQECPKCGKITAVADPFCAHCGVEIEAFIRQQQAEEEARLAREREEARRQAEQAARAKAEAQARARRNWVGCGIGCLLLFGMLAVGGVLLSGQATKQASRSAAAVATSRALIPKWIGNSIEVRAELRNVHDSSFEIRYQIINRTQSDYVVSFLTSDIVVSDDQGNTYPSRSSTQPVRDTISAGRDRVYTLYYEGALDPYASLLTLSATQISDERNITLDIPLVSLTDQIGVDFELNGAWDDGLSIRATVQNYGPSDFVARFRASNLAVVDDLGNQYLINEYTREDQYATLLNPGQWGSSKSYEWRFEPGIAPRATTLQVAITDFMGQQFAETIPLGTPTDGVRYEATVDYVSGSSFRIDFRAFNIGDDDLIVRFDEGSVIVQAASGQRFQSTETDRRRADIVRSGSYARYGLSFQGVPSSTSDLTLVFPIFSGTQNVQVPIQAQP